MKNELNNDFIFMYQKNYFLFLIIPLPFEEYEGSSYLRNQSNATPGIPSCNFSPPLTRSKEIFLSAYF